MNQSATILDAIRRWLSESGVSFLEKHHEPTTTSEESARARGESMSIGAKALLIKLDDRFLLFVLPADRKLDSGSVKKQLGAKSVRFANPAELLELTGLAPGSVPPFGPPILPFELVADPALGNNEKVAFNAGSLTDSVIMSFTDYGRVCGARWLAISRPPKEEAT